MFDNTKQIRAVQFGNLNEIFDERGSTFLALRKVQWVSEDSEVDESKAKLELRKWIVDKNGEEKANKGFSFLTEEGPHELANVLTKQGYGHTKDILKNLKERSDFEESVNTLYDSEDDGGDGDDYFDMRSALLAVGVEEEDDADDTDE